MTTALTFENLLKRGSFAKNGRCWQDFSKISSLLNLQYTMTAALTFEDFDLLLVPAR